jgi:transposase
MAHDGKSRRTQQRHANFPALAGPELNPVENIWQYLRANWLSNRVFDTYDAIIDAACEAWQKLLAQPQTITSIGMRKWAHVGQSS